jgi:hypothetical protein
MNSHKSWPRKGKALVHLHLKCARRCVGVHDGDRRRLACTTEGKDRQSDKRASDGARVRPERQDLGLMVACAAMWVLVANLSSMGAHRNKGTT